MPMYDKTVAEAQQLGTVGVSAAAWNAVAKHQLAPVGYRPSITEQLGMRKAQLLAELANVEAALEKAKEQSGAMGLLDAISRTSVGGNRDY